MSQSKKRGQETHELPDAAIWSPSNNRNHWDWTSPALTDSVICPGFGGVGFLGSGGLVVV